MAHSTFLPTLTMFTTSMPKFFTRSVALVATTAALVGSAMVPGVAAAQSTSITIGSAAEAMPMGPFGALPGGATVAMGQTFVRPTGPVCALTCYMQDFSFWLSPSVDEPSNGLVLRAYVAEWDGTKVTNVLYSSEERIGPTVASQQFTFGTSNVSINAGTQYIAFLSVVGISGLPGTAVADFDVVSGDPSPYADGALVFTNSATTFGDLTSTDWDYTGDPALQARFNANFTSSVVPEPSSVLLFATGAAALLLMVRRKQA
ncbi:MAG TPA: PEP-CTERM sorting domain-containing protein [Gemmatimonas aurantiaca]|uniref:Ice-binding protein C-terminal domain-containing protein n=2 Tax=Gemmatimonas aurantiaca TaxID=173480 RepID=C1ACR0_GEMAT|nr:PEP-CTERM sorting domain-containing protein [Gemmatimonas aurantiaca]BAH40287.1 hypothetical protein GAU_3245 [Gemmatimonas aurantiaca T-27]HCT57702.1 PEP-CTERM sorting domain-containing protein [Gemmatimonas aurantiaca]